MQNKILVTGKLHPQTVKAFENESSIQLVYKPDCKRNEIEKHIVGAQVLITRSETAVDKKLLDIASGLKIVARACVGVGNVDVEYASKIGVLVINAPGKNTNSAAELTFGLLLAAIRNIAEANNTLKSGGWDRHRFLGHELKNKTIGIIGIGNVGHRVARFCNSFDMKVMGYDPYISPSKFQDHKVKPVSNLSELIKNIDILSVHVPLNSETKGMITKDHLFSMKQGSIVINAARGGIIDEPGLVDALNQNIIARAAVDTFESEPNPIKPLTEHPNTVCTPHIGASTEEAQKLIGETVFDQVTKALNGGVVDYPVNLPELGVIENPIIKLYAVLAEKIGSFAAQTLNFNPESFEIHYRGQIADLDNSLARLCLLKGYLSHVVDDYVSIVNVKSKIKDLGIEVKESKDPGFTHYKSAIKIQVRGQDQNFYELGGVVLDEKYIRISYYNGFAFEIAPKGNLVVFSNDDKPGVIGEIGHFFARKKINISNFALSRDEKGGKAIAILGVDSLLKDPEKAEILDIPFVNECHFVSL